jgi:hypothetical protein
LYAFEICFFFGGLAGLRLLASAVERQKLSLKPAFGLLWVFVYAFGRPGLGLSSDLGFVF